jgi:hypothetical protein
MDLETKICPTCKREYAARLAACPGCVAAKRIAAPSAGPRVQREGPSRPRANRSRSYRMIDALKEMRKYRLALSGERLATFSIIGTEDWEDYASLAFDAMALEATLDIDTRLETMELTLTKLERHMARVVELLESDRRASQGSSDQ